MTTLYSLIREQEAKIDEIENLAESLREIGFTVEGGKIPTLKGVANQFLDDNKYDNNFVVRCLTEKSKLCDITNDVISMYRYNLKFPWNKNERQRYNKRVDQLAEVIPLSSNLKCGSVFSVYESEGMILTTTAAGAVTGFLLSYLAENSSIPDYFFPTMMGAIGLVLGSIAALQVGYRKKFKSWEEVNYIDEVLEGKRK